MPIKSYLVYPTPGKLEELLHHLNQLPNCEVMIPENNQDLLILVSDTADEREEKVFGQHISNIPFPPLNEMVPVSDFDI